MFVLTPQEKQFLGSVAQQEQLSSVSYVINALVNGVEVGIKDLYALDDSLMDIANEIEAEDLKVPPFIDAIKDIIGRLISTGPQVVSQNPANPITQYQQQGVPKKTKVMKPKVERAPAEPRSSRKEKYNDIELTGENVPQYLKDIHAIMMNVLEQRLADEIALRQQAEAKLAKLLEVLK